MIAEAFVAEGGDEDGEDDGAEDQSTPRPRWADCATRRRLCAMRRRSVAVLRSSRCAGKSGRHRPDLPCHLHQALLDRRSRVRANTPPMVMG